MANSGNSSTELAGLIAPLDELIATVDRFLDAMAPSDARTSASFNDDLGPLLNRRTRDPKRLKCQPRISRESTGFSHANQGEQTGSPIIPPTRRQPQHQPSLSTIEAWMRPPVVESHDQRTERDWNRKAVPAPLFKKQFNAVFFGAMLGMVTAVAGSLWIVSHYSASNNDLLTSKPPNAIQVAETTSRLRDQAERLVASYLASDSIDAKAAFVKEPRRVRPFLDEYFNRPEKSASTVTWDRMVSSLPAPLATGVQQVDVFVERQGYPLRCYFVEFDEATANIPLLDWESSEIYNPLPWAQFVNKRPPGDHIFRAALSKGDYYNFSFEDQSLWSCWKVRVVGEPEELLAYTPRRSALHQRLLRELPAGEGTYTVALAFPDHHPDEGVVYLQDVIQRGWKSYEARQSPKLAANQH